jgi:hypothetical protein
MMALFNVRKEIIEKFSLEKYPLFEVEKYNIRDLKRGCDDNHSFVRDYKFYYLIPNDVYEKVKEATLLIGNQNSEQMCIKCFKIKPINEFYKCSPVMYRRVCKQCRNEESRQNKIKRKVDN